MLVQWVAIGVSGLIGIAGLVFAGLAWREARAANRIAREAVELSLGPKFAFAVEVPRGRARATQYRLRNKGWAVVSGLKLSVPDDIGRPPGPGPWPPEMEATGPLKPGEAVFFDLGVYSLARGRWEWLQPAQLVVTIAESSEEFTVDLG